MGGGSKIEKKLLVHFAPLPTKNDDVIYEWPLLQTFQLPTQEEDQQRQLAAVT